MTVLLSSLKEWDSLKRINLLLKPASSLCNMRCRYCFYSDISTLREVASYGIMIEETVDKILDNIFIDIDDGDELNFGFQGGEPTLAGLPWFHYFIKSVNQRKKGAAVNYAFQTNGLLLDDSWCEFFRDNKFLIGLSIDAGKRFHDRNRLSSLGEGTYGDCIKTKELFDKNQVEYNILCVLTNEIAKEAERIWRFILNENISYIQFIPCLEPPPPAGSVDNRDGNILKPGFFAKFYTRLFPLWLKELENNNYISIKFYDDVVNYFLKGIPSSCGINGQCHNQYVIEADGSVFPCDFYCFDDHKAGNLRDNTLRDLFYSLKVQSFLSEKIEMPKLCQSCRFLKACRGGCKRMRNVMYAGKSDVFCGLRTFLEKCMGPLEKSVQKLFSG